MFLSEEKKHPHASSRDVNSTIYQGSPPAGNKQLVELIGQGVDGDDNENQDHSPEIP